MIEIKAALSYAVAYGATFEDFISKAYDNGFREVQLIPDQEPNLYTDLSGDRLRQILELKDSLGMTFHVHNVFYDINPVSLVPAVRQAAFDITRQVLETSRSMQAKSVTVHPGYMFAGWRRDEVQRSRFWRYAEDAMIQLADLAAEFDMPVLIENGSYYLCTASGPHRTPLHLGISPQEVRHLIELSGNRLKVALDINKAIRSGYPIPEFINELSGFIWQLQLSTATSYIAEISQVLSLLDQRSIAVVLEGSLEEAKDAAALLLKLSE